jgi:hypothetical protein
MRVIAAAAAVVALALPTAASADHRPGHPPSKASAFDQYVEQIPSSTGSKLPRRDGTKRPLAPGIADQLRAHGAEGALLEEFATRPGLGAPERTLKPTPTLRRELREKAEREPSAAASLSAVGSVVADGSGRRLLALLVVVGTTTMLLTVAALRRRRRGELVH